MNDAQKILITGASGFIGSNLIELLKNEFEILGLSRNLPKNSPELCRSVDLLNKETTHQAVKKFGPDFIVHAAGTKDVKFCEKNPEEAHRINVKPTETLLDYCKTNSCFMIYVSTDYVFDGQKGSYQEAALKKPVTVYGKTKSQAEDLVLRQKNTAVFRTSSVYGPHSPLLAWLETQLKEHKTVPAFTNVVSSPTSIHDFVGFLKSVFAEKQAGIFHAVGTEALSRYQLFKGFCEVMGFDEKLVSPSECDFQDRGHYFKPNLSLDSQHTQKTLGYRARTCRDAFLALKNS